MALVTNCYLISSSFPKEELFGLTSQIRRCCVSIPSNISEGYGRVTNKDYHRFLNISLGSLYEFQTQIEIAFNLKYIAQHTHIEIISLSTEIDKMLCSIIQKIK